MAATIVQVPAAELPQGKDVVVVVWQAAPTTVARYLHGMGASGALPSGQDLVAIIRSDELSSPDQIMVSSYERTNGKFNVVLKRQNYTGALAANVVTVALIEIELGSLSKGLYEVEVTSTVFGFSDIGRPEDVVQISSGSRVVGFSVA